MAEDVDIVELDAGEAAAAAGALAEVLVDCVAGGASVNFMASFTQSDGETFFARVAGEVAGGQTLLFAARVDGRILGTVQLGLDTPPNQPHRADIKKMLVHRAARRRGVGAALLAAAEQAAARRGRSVLVLDTVTGGDGERLYQRAGWTRVGEIPDYALFPDGRLCSTTVFWKRTP
jgi:GNAT superfamily N-acetyltransferase